MKYKKHKFSWIIPILIIALFSPLYFYINNFYMLNHEGVMNEEYAEFCNKGVDYTIKSSDKDIVIKTFWNEKNEKTILFVHGFGKGTWVNSAKLLSYLYDKGFNIIVYNQPGHYYKGDWNEKERVKSFSYGIKRLDIVLNGIKDIKPLNSKPIYLMGHSWGGFCVANIIRLHPEIEKVCILSGFDNIHAELLNVGKQMTGFMIYPWMYIFDFVESFNDYSDVSAIDCFENNNVKIMAIHSKDDAVVSINSGFNDWYEKYKDNERFKFVILEDAGHNVYITTNEDGKKIVNEKIVSKIIDFFNN